MSMGWATARLTALLRRGSVLRRFWAVRWRVWRDRLPPLPPGSFARDLRDTAADDRVLFRAAARHGPIFKAAKAAHPFVVVADLAVTRRLLAAAGQKVVTPDAPYSALIPGGDIRHREGEAHRILRRAIVGALRPAVVTANEAALRAIARDALGEISAASSPGAADLERALRRTADGMLMLAILGLGPHDPARAAFAAAFARLGPNEFVWAVGPPQAAAAAELIGLTTARLRNAAGAAPSALAEIAARPPEGLAVDDPGLAGNLVFMVETGRYDLRGLMRWIVHYLAHAPAVLDALRAAGRAATGAPGLAAGVVQETLRLDQSEALIRWVRESFAFEGMGVPRSSFLHLCTREAHRNPAVFPEPDRFDPQRFVGRTYDADSYAPFGLGHHRCVAADLVVRLGALVVEELAVGFDLTVLADGPRHHGPFHWEPSPDFAIALMPRRGVPRPGAPPADMPA